MVNSLPRKIAAVSVDLQEQKMSYIINRKTFQSYQSCQTTKIHETSNLSKNSSVMIQQTVINIRMHLLFYNFSLARSQRKHPQTRPKT